MRKFKKLSLVLSLVMLFTALFSGTVFAAPRLYGENRIETAIKIAEAGWPNGADTVIIAAGLKSRDAAKTATIFADALAGAPLAAALDAPILLVDANPDVDLDLRVRAALLDLAPSKVYVLGGPEAVPESVVEQIKEDLGLADDAIVRIEGKNRYETSAAIANAVIEITGADEALVVDGLDFGEALAVASYAAKFGIPVVYREGLVDVDEVVVDGDIYELSAEYAAKFDAPAKVLLATGKAFADAFAAAPYAAKINAPVVLVGDELSEAVAAFLASVAGAELEVLGGPNAVSEAVVAAAEEAMVVEEELAIKSVSVVGVKKIQVEFNKAVDTSKASFSVKKGNIVTAVTVAWNDDKTAATLTASIPYSAGEYTVTVSGLELENNVATVMVQPERIENIVADAAAYRDAANNTTVTLGYKVYNQYGEDITNQYGTGNFTVTSSEGNAAITAQGTITITNVADGKTTTFITIVDKTFAKSFSGYVEVLAAKRISSITLGTPEIKADKTRLEAGVADYLFPYTAVDQYGNSVTLTAADLAKITFVSSDRDVVDPDAAGAFEVKDVNGDGTADLTVDFKAFDGAKTVSVTAIVNATGASSTVTFTVYGNATPDTPALVAPSTRIGAGDVGFKIELKVVDVFGGEMSADDIVAAKAGLTVTSGNLAVFTIDDIVKDGDKAYVKIDAHGVGTANLTVTVNATGKSSTLAINVVEAKYPASMTLAPDYTYAVKNAVITLKATFRDQYGDVIESHSNQVTFEVDNNNFGTGTTTISVTDAVNNGVQYIASDYDKTTKVTVTLKDSRGNAIDVKEVTLTAVKADAALTYAVESVGTIAAAANGELNSAYAKEIKVYAKDASGNNVALPAGIIQGVIPASDKINAGKDGDVYKVAGVTDKEGEAPLHVVVNTNTGVKTISTTVNVSKDAPAAQSIVAKQGDDVITEVSIGTGTVDLFTSGSVKFVVTDQYGTTELTTDSYVSIFVTKPDGTVEKLTGHSYDFAAAGEYTVTAVTNNGLSVAVTVKVTAN